MLNHYQVMHLRKNLSMKCWYYYWYHVTRTINIIESTTTLTKNVTHFTKIISKAVKQRTYVMMIYDSDVLSKYFIDNVFFLVSLIKYIFTHNSLTNSAFKGILNEDMLR